MINLKHLLLFILVLLIVILLGFDFLKPALDIGLTPEDREFILRYKLLGPFPLTKLPQVWLERGAYTTVPIYYIGVVQSIAGFNYQLIQYIGIFFRFLAILSILSLTMLLFKNASLAAFTTIIFAFSYTTTGALETGVEPSEYLGLFLMNIFLISYYYLNTKFLLDLRWLIVISLLLFIAVMASIMRVYPILFLLPLIEFFLFFLNPNKYKFKYLIVKLTVFYLPFIFLKYLSPLSGSGHFALPSILSKINEGNWHLLLTPLQGLGFMIPVGKYYSNLGVLDLSSFNTYMAFLLGGPLVIFGFISLILTLVSVKRLSFFFRVLILNIGLEILTYWIVQQRLSVSAQFRLNFDIPRLYPVLFGFFLFSLMVNFLIDWYIEGKKNNLLLVLWVGLFFGLFFITMTYFFANFSLSFGGAQDHYLLIPTMGISLFLGGTLSAVYEKISNAKLKFAGGIALIMILLVSYYILNKEMTHNYFNVANFNGRAADGQELLQSKIREIFRDLDYSKPALVYFDTSDIPSGRGPFYSEGLLTPFSTLVYFKGEKIASGCIGVIHEDRKMEKLKKLIKTIDNQQVVVHKTACIENGRVTDQNVVYKPEQLYALKIKDGDLIDIREEVKKELGLR